MGRSKNSASSQSNIANALKNANNGEKKLKDMLIELHKLVKEVEAKRTQKDGSIAQLVKIREKLNPEQKFTAHTKSKLKTAYENALADADKESEHLRATLDKIAEIKEFRSGRAGDRPRQMRRGVLMSVLQNQANTLPLWVGKVGESVPPLCGAVPPDSNHVCKAKDKVAARVRGAEEEENWILAEVVSYDRKEGKYEVDDIDAEEGKERHTLSKRRVAPLPTWKANPETDPEALFPKGTVTTWSLVKLQKTLRPPLLQLVLALYPQTTCFYRALIHEPPLKSSEDYSVLFEDNSYTEGYSPPLRVAQRFVILCKDDKKAK